jgi:hypothetical protein
MANPIVKMKQLETTHPHTFKTHVEGIISNEEPQWSIALRTYHADRSTIRNRKKQNGRNGGKEADDGERDP